MRYELGGSHSDVESRTVGAVARPAEGKNSERGKEKVQEWNLPEVISALAIRTGTQQGVVDRAAPASVCVGSGRSEVDIANIEWGQVEL